VESKIQKTGTAAEIGLAHHLFLQFVSLDRVDGVAALKLESERLERGGVLSGNETTLLDFGTLAAFWNSELGQRVRAQAPFVHRELAFTARFAPADLAEFSSQFVDSSLEREYIIVRGTADLAVILPKQIWLIDFKTDAVRTDELPDRVALYRPQLRLYARSLSAIYRRPVSESWLYFLALRQGVPIE
jgi:ATP-dependent helicase/nuclease subunit A